MRNYWNKRSIPKLERRIGEIGAATQVLVKRSEHMTDRMRLHLESVMIVDLDDPRTYTDLTEGEARRVVGATCGICGKHKCSCDDDYERYHAKDLLDFGREDKLMDKE